MGIGFGHVPVVEIPIGFGAVFGWIIGARAARQAFANRFESGIDKARYRIALPVQGRDHPVRAGAEALICPAFQELARIDQNLAGHARRAEPRAIRFHDLKPVHIGLRQQCHKAGIGVRP